MACDNGYFEIAKWLSEKGIELDRANKYGNTAFHNVCAKGYFELAQCLAS